MERDFRGAAFKGEIHRGFLRVFRVMWPAVRSALDREVVAAGGGVTRVVFTGHSQGSPVAAMSAHASLRYLKNAKVTGATIEAVIFASPLRESPLPGRAALPLLPSDAVPRRGRACAAWRRRRLQCICTRLSCIAKPPRIRDLDPACSLPLPSSQPPIARRLPAGNSVFVKSIAKSVNLRSLVFDTDIISKVPCQVRCNCRVPG
jgi:hypothetical protein